MKTKAINQHRQGRCPPQRISTLVCGARAPLRNNHHPCLITSTNCASKAAVHVLAGKDIPLTLHAKLRSLASVFSVWSQKISQKIMMHSSGVCCILQLCHIWPLHHFQTLPVLSWTGNRAFLLGLLLVSGWMDLDGNFGSRPVETQPTMKNEVTYL